MVIYHRRFGTTYRPLDSWRWDRKAVPKFRSEINSTRCVITQRSAVLIYFAAEAWNRARLKLLILYSEHTLPSRTTRSLYRMFLRNRQARRVRLPPCTWISPMHFHTPFFSTSFHHVVCLLIMWCCFEVMLTASRPQFWFLVLFPRIRTWWNLVFLRALF